MAPTGSRHGRRGIDFFVGGAILAYGRFAWSIEWSIEDVEETLSEWHRLHRG